MTDEQFTKQFISLSNTFYELSRYQEDYDKLIDLENKLNSSYIEEVGFDNSDYIRLEFYDKHINDMIKNYITTITLEVKNKRDSILRKYINEVKNY